MEYYRLMDGDALGFIYRLDRDKAVFEQYIGEGAWELNPDIVKHHMGLAQDYKREEIGADLNDWLKLFDDRLKAQ